MARNVITWLASESNLLYIDLITAMILKRRARAGLGLEDVSNQFPGHVT